MNVVSKDSSRGQPAAAHGNITRPMLLRRLMVACPVTHEAIDTGFELSAVPTAGAGPQRLVDCMECGQDHLWTVEETFLD